MVALVDTGLLYSVILKRIIVSKLAGSDAIINNYLFE